jgi:hypothetical protein
VTSVLDAPLGTNQTRHMTLTSLETLANPRLDWTYPNECECLYSIQLETATWSL